MMNVIVKSMNRPVTMEFSTVEAALRVYRREEARQLGNYGRKDRKKSVKKYGMLDQHFYINGAKTCPIDKNGKPATM